MASSSHAAVFGPVDGLMAVVADEIRAEMVANVLEVVAREGTPVAAGDTVVLLESMKMEIPVLAEVGGSVVSVAVKEGDVVQGGDLIAVLERASEDD
jgi:acetyl-CoA carboxylase biotin carboxyl carrier protein